MTELMTSFHCDFAAGGWNADDFIKVRSPYFDDTGEWEQMQDHIANRIPEGCTPADGLGQRGNEFFVGMVAKNKIGSGVKISSRMSFHPEMAPLIVFENELARRENGEFEFKNHIEIVIFNKGINIWRHFGKNCKPRYCRAAFAEFELLPDVIYNLETTIDKDELMVEVDGKRIGCYTPELAQPFHFGIIACEGLNRFYDLVAEPIVRE